MCFLMNKRNFIISSFQTDFLGISSTYNEWRSLNIEYLIFCFNCTKQRVMSKNISSNYPPLFNSNFVITEWVDDVSRTLIFKKVWEIWINLFWKFISDVDSSCNQEILEFWKTNWFCRSHPVGWRYYVSIHHMFSQILNFICYCFLWKIWLLW